MGARRIPAEAFEDFYALGPTRSYATLAEKYRVSKQAIARRAKAEYWQQRVQERDEKVRAAVSNKVEETIADLRARHAKILKAMTAKALEALKLPMTSAMDGVRTLDLILKQERLLNGLPTGAGSTLNVQQQVNVPHPRPSGWENAAYLRELLRVAQASGLLPPDFNEPGPAESAKSADSESPAAHLYVPFGGNREN